MLLWQLCDFNKSESHESNFCWMKCHCTLWGCLQNIGWTSGVYWYQHEFQGSFKQLWLEIALVHCSELKKAEPIWMESLNWNTTPSRFSTSQRSLLLKRQAARRHRLTTGNIFGRLPFTNPKLLRWSSILWKVNHSEENKWDSLFTSLHHPAVLKCKKTCSLVCLNSTAARMPAPRSECKI